MDKDKIFTEFLSFCGGHLGKSKDMIRLVRKRYRDCDSNFTSSEEFVSLMEATKESIQADSKRTFVYLRHFLNKLKARKLNTEDVKASKKCHDSDTVSVHDKHGKGVKRPNNCETAVQSERPLKHPRHELLMKGEPLIDLSADETDESSESGSEHTDETENHSTDNTYNSSAFKTKTMISVKPSTEHEKTQNISQNWQHFKFKQSVMSSVKAAASSFSDRLSKTISKASGAQRTTKTKVDNVDIDVQYISSLSRSPSPELPEFDLSCKPSQAKSHSGNNDTHKCTSNLANNKYNRNEIIRSAEITSTTNLETAVCHDKQLESSSKQKRDISNCLGKSLKGLDITQGKVKETAYSEVGLKDLDKDINGYTVEMNVSSDDEVHDDSNSIEIEEDMGKINEETMDFTSHSKTHHNDETIEIDHLEDCKEQNVSSLSVQSRLNVPSAKSEAISSDMQSNKNSSSKIFGTQESVILLESDDSSSEESEDQKVLLFRKEVDTLFEGSDCEELGSEQLPGVDCKLSKSDHSNRKLSKPNHLNHTDNRMSDQINSNEIHENSKCESSHFKDKIHCVAVDDEKDKNKDNGFPAVLGLVSVDKVEKEKTEAKKRQSFVTIPSTSRDTCNKVKIDSKEEADEEEQEHTKKGKKGSQRQIQMLETLLKQLRDKIEKVRERELSLDELDDEASDYILEDKLQKKFVEVYEKLCKLHKATSRTGRPVDMVFKYEGTRYPEVNRRIMRFVNRYKEFPDYRDIRKVIVKVNKDKGLKLRGKAIDELAREAFTDVGNQLQRRRQEDFMSTFTTPFTSAVKTYDDPALYDPDLKRKLENNRKLAKSRMDTVVEKYTQMQYDVGDKGSSDDESDDDGPKKEEDDLDPECIGVKDTEPNEGLAKTSRSDRTPLILESSQLEIVNDEEEDIVPYFEETQIDEDNIPVSDTDTNIQPKNQAYEAETQLQSDGGDESIGKSDNESSLSPDAVKLEMDKVIDIFDEGDEIEIVSDCSESEQETNTNFDSLHFTDIKVKVESVEEAFQSDSIETVNPLDTKELNSKELNNSNVDHSLEQEKNSASVLFDRKPDSIENIPNICKGKTIPNSENINDELKLHNKAVENIVCKAGSESICKNSHLPSNAVFSLKDTRQDSKDSTTDVDNDLDSLVKQIAADQENSNGSESDVEMKDIKNLPNSGAGTSQNIETKAAVMTNKTESDEITEIIQNSGSPESEIVCEDDESLTEKPNALGLDDMKEAETDTISEVIAANDPIKLDGKRSSEKPQTDKTKTVVTAKIDEVTENNEKNNVSQKPESIHTNEISFVESSNKQMTNKTKLTDTNKEKEGNKDSEKTSASPKLEIVSAGKVSPVENSDKCRTDKTKTDEIDEAPCIVIDSTEDISDNKVKIQKSSSESSPFNTLSTNSLQDKTEDLTEDHDSDVEIVDDYNPNNEYYPEDEYNTYEPHSEEMDSQGTYSSKNLNYDDDSMDCEEISDPLDSTSTLVDENNHFSNRGYEHEITSTLVDTVDIKVPRRVTKERFRAPFVTLKKPIDRKHLVNPVLSSSREENLDLIETYAEPDSTPYTDDMVVSSSCQNDIIVLSDSE